MEDRGSKEIEGRIEDEGKRISQGGHNKEGKGRGGGPKTRNRATRKAAIIDPSVKIRILK